MGRAVLSIVRPRVSSPETGETLLLEDMLLPLIESGVRASVLLRGAPGSGKRTALAFLAGRVEEWPGLIVMSDPDQERVEHPDGLLVYTKPAARRGPAQLVLAPWGIDEVLEALQDLEPGDLRHVLDRLDLTSAFNEVGQSAEVWCLVLESLLSDESLRGAHQALVAGARALLPDPEAWRELERLVLELRHRDGIWFKALLRLEKKHAVLQRGDGRTRERLSRLLRHRALRLALALDALAKGVEARDERLLRQTRASGELITGMVPLLRGDEGAHEWLRGLMDREAAPFQPMAASLLHACDQEWHPTAGTRPVLEGALLDGIHWVGAELGTLPWVRLSGANLSHARPAYRLLGGDGQHSVLWSCSTFAGASLVGADLPELQALSCDFTRADLRRASFCGASFESCSFRAARMSGALLCRAVFEDADLRDAVLCRANLQGACLDGHDLRSVDLAGASLAEASLVEVNLEEAVVRGLDLRNANLSRSSLSGARLVGCNLTGARLSGGRLAHVDMRGCNLQGVHFDGVSFHMGSTRSGMLSGAPASWGTRTGFYSEPSPDAGDFDPEPSSVADLRGADLRGAHVEEVDFYRVDLRGARFTNEQRAWFVRCKAILDKR